MKIPKFHLDRIFKELEIEEIDAVESAVLPQPLITTDVQKLEIEDTEKQPDQARFLGSEIASYPLNDLAAIVFYRLHNKLLLHSITPSELESKLILPAGKGFAEAFADKISFDLQTFAAQHRYEISKSHVIQHPGVKDPILILSAVGFRPATEADDTFLLRSGLKLIVLNSLAPVPILLLTELYGEKIRYNFDPEFYKWCRELDYEAHISGKSFMKFRKKFPSPGKYYLMGEGGVAACSYNLVKNYGVGVEIDLEKLPMFTTTKLLCDLFRLDPLCIDATGSLLAALDERSCEELLTLCTERNIPATVVGELTDSHTDCLFTNYDDNKLRMFNPDFDELHRFRYDLL